MLYLHAPAGEERWCAAFRAAAPELRIVTAADRPDRAAVRYFAGWAPPAGLIGSFPNLRAVFALGAGVDKFLQLSDLSPALPLIRLVDAGMARQMIEYALFGVLWFQRDFDSYAEARHRAEWRAETAWAAERTRIGVLGLGALGGQVARALAGFGYPVAGWRRSGPPVEGVRTLTGTDGLAELLAESDVLLALLPSTPDTRGLLDAAALSRLPKGAGVVNMGRGDQLDPAALLGLIDAGHLRGAVLDVFAAEPLPAESPLWRHPRVLVTPHVAAATLPEPSARQIAENIRRIKAGQPAAGLVDRSCGY